jgi:CubicO group peptidase (beta-lactamase class C family)
VVSENVAMVYNTISYSIQSQYFRKGEIRDKVKNVLQHKIRHVPAAPKEIPNGATFSKVNSPNMLNLSYQVYSKAYTVKRKGKKLMPFPELENTNFASLVLGFSESKTFQETLGKYAPFVHYKLPDVSFDPFDLQILSDQLSQFDNVIIGLHTTGLLELDQSLLKFLKSLNAETDVVLVILGRSLLGNDLLEFDNILYMHEDNILTQQLAAQAIFTLPGESDMIDRLSYSLPEIQRMDSKVLSKIDRIVEEAITMGATPGCQVLVARNGSVIMEKGYGYYTYDSIMPVDTRTIYDLASITKVAATTHALMKLNEQGKIHLDSAIGTYLPELKGSDKASLVIRDVLSHQSGLKAFYPFWRNTIEDEDQTLYYYADMPDEIHNQTVAYGMFAAEDLKDSIWNWTVDMDLRKKDRDHEVYDYKYSDLGFYLLQVLVERVSETALDTFVDSVFYNSMGMSTLTFNPLCRFPIQRIAPTERDYEFRRVLVWGTVHDQIAAMKGGVSGHAGLFGNAHDIAKLMQMQLQRGSYGGKRYLEEKTIAEFTAQQYEKNRRGLGWDKPEKGDEYNPASRYASFDAFGHSGFTGTVVWADPTFDLIFVFLSNRIYPDSNNGKLVEFNIRKRIHDVVYESMWNFEKFYH